jgi:hypothetical protein
MLLVRVRLPREFVKLPDSLMLLLPLTVESEFMMTALPTAFAPVRSVDA